MTRFHRLLILLLCSCLHTAIPAQPVKKFYFTHYTNASGLISTEVNAVVQDTEGYIWVGSVDGLQRFDGTRFNTYVNVPGDPYSLPVNNIIQLLFDKKNRLWVLTAEGATGIFDTRTFRFTRVNITNRSKQSVNASVKRLILDESGNIFLLYGAVELVTWNEQAFEFSWKYNFFDSIPGSPVFDFVQQPGTPYYWIAGTKGIHIYNRSTNVLSSPGNNREHWPVIDVLSSIISPVNLHFDRRGRCWFQSWQYGLPRAFRIDPQVNNPVPENFEFVSLIKSYYETQRFYEQRDGTIWIGGLNLFARFQEQNNGFQLVYNGYLNERSISYERVNCLFEDREKNIWVATDNNGLYRFNPGEQYFTNVSHLERINKTPGKGSLMSFVPTRWGTLLAGSWSDGVYQYDKNLNHVPLNIKGLSENSGPSVWGMCASGDSNTLWLSAQPGLIAINQATRTAKSYNPPQLNNKTVRQVAEDREGNLWMGVQNFGLFTWAAADKNAGKTEQIRRYEPVPAVMVNKVLADSKGLVWVGTSVNGLYVIDPVLNKTVLHFSDSSRGAYQLPEAGISSILEYDDSLMVITTSRHLLIYNRYLRQTRLSGKAGLMKGYIASVQRDQKGYLWVATTNSLYRANFRARAFVEFNRGDGIDNDHFILASSIRLPDGRLVFGSSTEFIVFSPDSMRISSTPPLPRITEFRVKNKPLLVDSLLHLDRVELRYGSNSIEISYSPMVYSSAYSVLYKMEGIDKDWRIAIRDNQAVYSYLPSGKYKFMLKTLNGEGQTSEVLSVLEIRIIPPFWKSWWFFCGLAVLAGVLLFWFDRERFRRKEAILKMRSNIADNLHHEVNVALNNINILSEMARLKAEKDPAKSKEYIEQIHNKSHNMIVAMDDMLWSLDPGNDSMEKTTDRMREYIDALKNRYGVNIDIAVDHKVETLPLNMKLRHDAFLVFKEGLKNLVALGAENLHVYIKSEKNDLLFISLFDSEHCDMQQLNNLLHRPDLEKRLNMLSADIDVDLHKSHSAITLRVPVS